MHYSKENQHIINRKAQKIYNQFVHKVKIIQLLIGTYFKNIFSLFLYITHSRKRSHRRHHHRSKHHMDQSEIPDWIKAEMADAEEIKGRKADNR